MSRLYHSVLKNEILACSTHTYICAAPEEMYYEIIFIFFTGSTDPLGPWPLIFQFRDRFTDGRTPWRSDQPVARPLPNKNTE
jgi:hypothetical protein